MKQYRTILPLVAALLVSACGGDSALPNPTGKASVRAINAIKASSSVNFRIEEQSIGTIDYREISTGARYDDFSYTFNFDIFFAGDEDATRLASQPIDFVADQDYTLLLSGTVAAPTVTVWEITEREFDSAATVFQARFSHTADSLAADTIDVYFALDGTAPVAGEQVATLTFGDISAPVDFEAGSYVITLTTAGDVNDVLFVSAPTGIAAAGNFIITPFDGTVNDIAPLGVRILGAGGLEFEMSNPNSTSVIQFLNAAADVGVVDIYDDENLTSLVFDDLAYQQLTPEQPLTDLAATYRYTPFDNTGTILVERQTAAQLDKRYRMVMSGSAGAYVAVLSTPDRKPIDTAAKLIITNETQNFPFVTLYAMDPGEVPDSTTQVLRGALASGLGPNTSFLPDGMFDIYVTDASATDFTIIAGPVPVDVAVGDVHEFMIFDNAADPAIADLLELVETP